MSTVSGAISAGRWVPSYLRNDEQLSTPTTQYTPRYLRQEPKVERAVTGSSAVQGAERTFLNEVFDLLSIGQYATAGFATEAVRAGNKGEFNPLAGIGGAAKGVAQGLSILPFWEGFKDPADYSWGKDVMTQVGWEPTSTAGKIAKGAVGLAGDVFLDPLTYVTLGGTSLLKGTGKVGQEVIEKATRQLAEGGLSKASKEVAESLVSSGVRQLSQETAEDIVRKFAIESSQQLSDEAISKAGEDFVKKWNQILGQNRLGNKGASIGIGNAPLIGNLVKDPSKYSYEFISKEAFENMGDKTLAPIVDKITESFYTSPLGKKFSTKTGLRELAERDPEMLYKTMQIFKLAGKNNLSRVEAMQVAKKLAEDFGINEMTPAARKQAIKALQGKEIIKYLDAQTGRVADDTRDLFNSYLNDLKPADEVVSEVTDIGSEIIDERNPLVQEAMDEFGGSSFVDVTKRSEDELSKIMSSKKALDDIISNPNFDNVFKPNQETLEDLVLNFGEKNRDKITQKFINDRREQVGKALTDMVNDAWGSGKYKLIDSNFLPDWAQARLLRTYEKGGVDFMINDIRADHKFKLSLTKFEEYANKLAAQNAGSGHTKLDSIFKKAYGVMKRDIADEDVMKQINKVLVAQENYAPYLKETPTGDKFINFIPEIYRNSFDEIYKIINDSPNIPQATKDSLNSWHRTVRERDALRRLFEKKHSSKFLSEDPVFRQKLDDYMLDRLNNSKFAKKADRVQKEVAELIEETRNVGDYINTSEFTKASDRKFDMDFLVNDLDRVSRKMREITESARNVAGDAKLDEDTLLKIPEYKALREEMFVLYDDLKQALGEFGGIRADKIDATDATKLIDDPNNFGGGKLITQIAGVENTIKTLDEQITNLKTMKPRELQKYFHERGVVDKIEKLYPKRQAEMRKIAREQLVELEPKLLDNQKILKALEIRNTGNQATRTADEIKESTKIAKKAQEAIKNNQIKKDFAIEADIERVEQINKYTKQLDRAIDKQTKEAAESLGPQGSAPEPYLAEGDTIESLSKITTGPDGVPIGTADELVKLDADTLDVMKVDDIAKDIEIEAIEDTLNYKEFVEQRVKPQIEGLSDLEAEGIARIRKEFIKMGREEFDAGLLKADQLNKYLGQYFPGVLTKKGMKHFGKDGENTLGTYITGLFGAKQTGKPSFANQKYIQDIVAYNEKNGDIFMEDIANVWVARSLMHHDAFYQRGVARKAVNDLGFDAFNKGRYIQPEEGFTTTIAYGELMDKISDAAKNEVKAEMRGSLLSGDEFKKKFAKKVEKLKLEWRDEYGFDFTDASEWGKPMVELDARTAQRFVEDFGMQDSIKNVHNAQIEVFNRARNVELKKNASQFWQTYDKFLHLWKLNVTAALPGFHSRNAVANQFQNFLGIGADVLDPKLQSGALKAIKTKGGFTGEAFEGMQWSELYDEAVRVGLLDEGYFKVDFDEESSMINAIGQLTEGNVQEAAGDAAKFIEESNLNPLDPKGFLLYKTGQELGSFVENRDRLIHYAAMRKKGETAEAAAEHVNQFLFDYSDLTEFEHVTMKRLFPFYTWMKKNTQLQLEQAVLQPNVYRNTNKILNAIEGGESEDKEIPEWAQQYVELPFDVGGEDAYFNPMLPIQDLNNLPANINPVDYIGDLLTRSTPALKAPVELGLDKNLYFDSPIDNEFDYLMSYFSAYNFGRSQASPSKDTTDKALDLLNKGTGIGIKRF